MRFWKRFTVGVGVAALVVGAVVASFYWDPSANWVAGYRVTSAVLVTQPAVGPAQLRLESGEVVAAHFSRCPLDVGESYVLSERTQVDGDREYVLVCLDADCERVPNCSFDP